MNINASLRDQEKRPDLGVRECGAYDVGFSPTISCTTIYQLDGSLTRLCMHSQAGGQPGQVHNDSHAANTEPRQTADLLRRAEPKARELEFGRASRSSCAICHVNGEERRPPKTLACRHVFEGGQRKSTEQDGI